MDARSPRSLVGMTMGARKREAHRDLLMREAEPHRPDEAAWFVASLHFRASLRIGERLRPCHGCVGCQPYERRLYTATDLCNGSGVLPTSKETSR